MPTAVYCRIAFTAFGVSVGWYVIRRPIRLEHQRDRTAGHGRRHARAAQEHVVAVRRLQLRIRLVQRALLRGGRDDVVAGSERRRA